MIWRTSPLVIFCITGATAFSDIVSRIVNRAQADGIDIESQPWASAAFTAIDQLHETNIKEPPYLSTATRIDTHCHAVPTFYYDIMPIKPKPWSVQNQLQHMANLNISHTVLSIPWPGASVYSGNKTASIALARIINEYMAEVVRKYPTRFSFFATVPLPYAESAMQEAQYALSDLGAVGIGLFTNHEGRYLGDPELQLFFTKLNALNNKRAKVIFVHPALPTCKPAFRNSALVEFYWDTAQALTGLTLSRTLHNFTSLKYIISHGGGAFPSIEDRLFWTENLDFKTQSEDIYKTRMWWDSAGTTYPRQIQGLLAYDIPKTQLLYGTDFPFNADIGAYGPAAKAVADASFLTTEEKAGVFRGNALSLLPSILR